jgi:hypothetical protein
MQTEMSIEIERPITQVFDYTTNNVAEWCSVVVKDEVIDKKPEGVGTTFRVMTEERGHRMELDGVVTRHEPPTAHAVFMKGKQVDIEAEYFFKDLGGRSVSRSEAKLPTSARVNELADYRRLAPPQSVGTVGRAKTAAERACL